MSELNEFDLISTAKTENYRYVAYYLSNRPSRIHSHRIDYTLAVVIYKIRSTHTS